MISKTEEKMEEFPDTPAWTMFFDGPLYQKYDEFMKNKDFSKVILVNFNQAFTRFLSRQLIDRTNYLVTF